MTPGGNTTPGIIIPLNFDTTGMDAQIAEAQAKLVKAFNASKGSLSGAKAQSFSDVEYYLNQAVTPAQLGSIKGQNPQLNKAIGSYNRFAASGQSDDDRKNDQRDQRNAMREQLRALQDLNNSHRQATNTISRGMAVGGAFATGNSGPLQRAFMGWAMGSLSQVLATAILGNRGTLTMGTGGSGGNAGSGGSSGGGGAGTQAQPGTPASAVTQVASATAQALTTQLAKNALTTGTGTAADSGVGLSLLEKLFGSGAGEAGLAAGAGVGIASIGALGTNAAMAWGASMRRQQYNLVANVAGSGSGVYAENAVQTQAHNYLTDPNTVAEIYQALGNMGVQGIHNVSQNANNALAISRITGMGIDQATQMTGTFAVQGGMSSQDIASMYESAVKGSKSLNVSITGLLDTMESFAKATNNANLSVKGSQGIMALQGMLGTRINAGSAIAPLANAGGSQAYTLEHILGMSATQFQSMQVNNPALLAAKYGQWLGGMAGSGSQAQREQNMQIINAGMGSAGFDISGMSNVNQDKFLTAMTSAGSLAQIQDVLNKFHMNTIGPGSSALQTQLTQQGVNVSRDVTSPAEKLSNLTQTQMNSFLDAFMGNTPIMNQEANPLSTNFTSLGGNVGGDVGQFIHNVATIIGNVSAAAGASPNPGNNFNIGKPGVSPGNTPALEAVFGTPLERMLAGLVAKGLTDAGDLLKSGSSSLADDLTTAIGNAFSSVFGGVGSAFGTVEKNLSSLVGGAAPLVEGTGSSILKGFSSLFGGSVSAGGLDPSGSISGPAGIQPFAVYKRLADTGSLASQPVTPSASQLALFQAASSKYHVPLALLLAQAATESGFNPPGPGSGGAMGIGQFEPATWTGLAANRNSPVYGTPQAAISGAYDQSANIAMMAYYDSTLYAAKGSWTSVIGPYGENNPNYDSAVDAAYAKAQIQINLQVADASQNGVTVTATKAPSINHSRTPKGSRSPASKPVMTAPPPMPPPRPRTGPQTIPQAPAPAPPPHKR